MIQQKESHIVLITMVIIMLMLVSSVTITAFHMRDPQLTIETDKPIYYPGETVAVSGYLTNDGEPVPFSTICPSIYDQNGQLIAGICGITNDTGGFSLSHILAEDALLGVYNATVHSGEFNISAYTTFEVISSEIQADAGGPYEAVVGQPVQLYGNATGGYPPYEWLWDLGDGNTSTDQMPIHIYSYPGEYQVLLNVSDQNDQYALDKTIVVITEESDVTPPIVELLNPQPGLYIFGIFIRQLPGSLTIIIGPIDIAVNATDNQSGIDYVEITIDDELQTRLTDTPYTWSWTEPTFLKHTLQISVADNAGNTEEIEKVVWKFL